MLSVFASARPVDSAKGFCVRSFWATWHFGKAYLHFQIWYRLGAPIWFCAFWPATVLLRSVLDAWYTRLQQAALLEASIRRTRGFWQNAKRMLRDEKAKK